LAAAAATFALQRSIHFCFDSAHAAIMVRHASARDRADLKGRNAGVAT
jgi:hypothetical protein